MRALLVALVLAAGAAVLVVITAPASAVETADCAEPELPIVIEADEVTFLDESGRIQFEGNVVTEHEGRTLNAQRVIWNRERGQVEILGTFTIVFPDGNELSGENGTFDEVLQTGTIFGIEALIHGGPLRVLADKGEKTADGDLHLTRASFSPCPISEDDPTPAWRIRSDSVHHDTEARDLIYSASILEVGGVPVFFLPYLRQPDATVKWRSGFLSPSMRSNSAYGIGLRMPYHLAIAPDRSATLTTFTTTKEGVILEGEYRQLFADGDLDMEASLAHRSLLDPEVTTPRRSHGHFFLNVHRETADQYRYGAEVNLASEKGYLRRYGYSEDDRLRNRVFVERFGDDFQLDAESVAFQSQRDDESNRRLRYAMPEVRYHRVLPEPALGGELRFGGDVRYLNCRDCRRSQSAGLEAEWNRHHVFSSGIVAAMHARLRGDIYAFGNQNEEIASQNGGTDPEVYDTTTRGLPQVGVEVSLPLLRAAGGEAHILEPVAQVILAPRRSMSDDIPNEDSLDVEFDEHSLFARNRFSGRDNIETGNRGAYGVRYRYLSASGLALGGIAGRVVRQRPEVDFPERSGLRDTHSDIVGAWSLRLREPLALRLNHRVRLSNRFSMRRNDFTLRAEAGRFDLSGTYLYVDADDDDPDPNLDLEAPTNFEAQARGEIQTRLGMDLERKWHLAFSHRRDVEHHSTISIAAELLYEHECFELLFTAERDYIASENAPGGTTLGLSLRLLTF